MARWSPNLHPRGKDGKFATKGGGRKRDGRLKRAAIVVGIAALNQNIRSNESSLRAQGKTGPLYKGSDRAHIAGLVAGDKKAVAAARARLARGHR